MAYRSTSLSCTVYQGWIYGVTGGSAGGSKYCTGSMTVTVYQRWGWDGNSWQTDGDRIDSSPSIMNYGPDSEGYSGQLDRTSVSGSPLPPQRNGAYFGESVQTQISGTAYYGKTLTKADTRTYGWTTNGSQTDNAPSSTYYDDGTYAGTLYKYSVVGSPPTPTGTASIGSTTSTSASGTAYYDGDIPLKVPSTPSNFRVSSVSTSGVTLAWNGVTNVDYYAIEIYLASPLTLVDSDYSISSGSTTKFFTGLFSDTEYQAKLYARNSAGNSSPTYVNFTTQSEVPNPPSSPTNFRVTSYNTDSVNLAWDTTSGATSYAVETYLQGTSNLVSSDYSISGTTKFITGLTPNTNYTFKLWAINGGGNSTPVFTSQKTNALTPTKPPNWSWTSLVSSSQTNPNTTYHGTIPLVLVSANDWNNFTARINAFRTYKGLANYSFSSVGSGSPFTPAIYNQAVNAILPMATPSLPSGYYSKLIALRDALNSIT